MGSWAEGCFYCFFFFFFLLTKGYYALMVMCQAVPARSACLPGKPAWAPREWSWLEALRHSSIQVKSSPPGNSLINRSHHYTAVQKCKVVIIAHWPVELPTAQLQNKARTSLSACHQGSALTQEMKQSGSFVLEKFVMPPGGGMLPSRTPQTMDMGPCAPGLGCSAVRGAEAALSI